MTKYEKIVNFFKIREILSEMNYISLHLRGLQIFPLNSAALENFFPLRLWTTI